MVEGVNRGKSIPIKSHFDYLPKCIADGSFSPFSMRVLMLWHRAMERIARPQNKGGYFPIAMALIH